MWLKDGLLHLACHPRADGRLRGDPGNIAFPFWVSRSSFEQREGLWMSSLPALEYENILLPKLHRKEALPSKVERDGGGLVFVSSQFTVYFSDG